MKKTNFQWYVILGLALAVLLYFYVKNNVEDQINSATSINDSTTTTV